MKITNAIFISSLLLLACHNKQAREKIGPPVPLIIHEITKDIAINDVVDISNDTIIAVKYLRGLLLSTNGAKTWRDMFPNQLTKEATVDDRGH